MHSGPHNHTVVVGDELRLPTAVIDRSGNHLEATGTPVWTVDPSFFTSKEEGNELVLTPNGAIGSSLVKLELGGHTVDHIVIIQAKSQNVIQPAAPVAAVVIHPHGSPAAGGVIEQSPASIDTTGGPPNSAAADETINATVIGSVGNDVTNVTKEMLDVKDAGVGTTEQDPIGSVTGLGTAATSAVDTASASSTPARGQLSSIQAIDEAPFQGGAGTKIVIEGDATINVGGAGTTVIGGGGNDTTSATGSDSLVGGAGTGSGDANDDLDEDTDVGGEGNDTLEASEASGGGTSEPASAPAAAPAPAPTPAPTQAPKHQGGGNQHRGGKR